MTKEENKIVLALDNEVEDGLYMIDEIEEDPELAKRLYGYKVSSRWVMNQSLSIVENLNDMISPERVIILDMQKWPTDIPEIIANQVNDIGERESIDELIGCPMGTGRKGLEAFVVTCDENAMDPIIVLEMTHPDADSYLTFSTPLNILRDSAKLGVSKYLIPSTKTPRGEVKTILEVEFSNIKPDFYATGFKVQQGQVGPMVKFGVNKFVVGRAIYESPSYKDAIMGIYDEINRISE